MIKRIIKKLPIAEPTACFVSLAFIFVVIIGVLSYFLTHIYGVSFTKLL